MTPVHFASYALRIEPLTPIHIGGGTSIEPYEYALANRAGNGWLVALDLPRFFATLTPQLREEFYKVERRGDFTGLRAWIREHASGKEQHRFEVAVQAKAFNELLKHQNDPARLGLIELSTRDPATGRPFIPGSSIKGCIRTALVAQAVQRGDQRRLRNAADDHSAKSSSARFEAVALGHADPASGRPDLYSDPLRQLAFSDAPMSPAACYIDRVQILHARERTSREQNDPSGIQIYRDVTWSRSDGDEEIEAVGELRHLHALSDPRRMRSGSLRKIDGPAQICAACNAFYRPHLESELGRFQFQIEAETRDMLLTAAGSMQANQCLVRMGRHSHFECITASKEYAKPPKRGYGATRTYVDGNIPLGWARLTFTPRSTA